MVKKYDSPVVFNHFGDKGITIPRTTAFLVPFNRTISKYENVTFALAVSLVKNTTGDNILFENCDQFFSNNNSEKCFSFGFRNSGDSNLLPREDLMNFFGIVNSSSSSGANIHNTTSGIFLYTDSGVGASLGFCSGTSLMDFAIGDAINLGLKENQTGEFGYCTYLGVNANVIDKNISNQSIELKFNYSTGHSSSSRSDLLAFVNSLDSGIYYSGSYSGPEPFELPKAAFLYWPFTRSLIRIHGLLIKAHRVTTS